MEGPDTAAADGASFVRHFVLNVAGRELRSQGERIILPIEAAFHSALALGEPTLENGVHLKSFLRPRCLGVLLLPQTPQIAEGFQAFLRSPKRDVEKPSLVQGLVRLRKPR